MTAENTDFEEIKTKAPTIITVESTYRTREGEKTETYELELFEVGKLLELAMRDSLDGVDARIIQNEVQARSR